MQSTYSTALTNWSMRNLRNINNVISILSQNFKQLHWNCHRFFLFFNLKKPRINPLTSWALFSLVIFVWRTGNNLLTSLEVGGDATDEATFLSSLTIKKEKWLKWKWFLHCNRKWLISLKNMRNWILDWNNKLWQLNKLIVHNCLF